MREKIKKYSTFFSDFMRKKDLRDFFMPKKGIVLNNLKKPILLKSGNLRLIFC